MAGPPDDPRADFRTEVISLKHVEARNLMDVLDPFTSQWGQIDHNRELNVITISDKPALVEQMLAVIERLDQPRSELELTVFLIEASRDGKADPQLTAALSDVWADLKGLFAYKGYRERDRALLRVTADRSTTQRIGGEDGYEMEIQVRELDPESGRFQLAVSIFKKVEVSSDGKVLFVNENIVSTTMEVKDGKTSVVGASRLNGDDRALITVIKTKVVR
ncbi:MAG: hypothetical protein GY898_13880 [Proteobacteria bacterium]|nr:hypothetical protein [Pseudomonadota bacterium]